MTSTKIGAENKFRFNRRDFLKLGVTAGVGAAVARLAGEGCKTLQKKPSAERGLPKVPSSDSARVGFIGVGHRGAGHVRNFLKPEGVQIKAICDIVPYKSGADAKTAGRCRFPGACGLYLR